MKNQRLYLNVYRSGTYHRQGKPGHCNIHGGDFFTTLYDALTHAESANGYVTTVEVDIPVPEGYHIVRNPDNSVPTPLHMTRGNLLTLLPWRKANQDPPIMSAQELCGLSLDTSEREAVAPARAYKPAHGGYPGTVRAAEDPDERMFVIGG